MNSTLPLVLWIATLTLVQTSAPPSSDYLNFYSDTLPESALVQSGGTCKLGVTVLCMTYATGIATIETISVSAPSRGLPVLTPNINQTESRAVLILHPGAKLWCSRDMVCIVWPDTEQTMWKVVDIRKLKMLTIRGNDVTLMGRADGVHLWYGMETK